MILHRSRLSNTLLCFRPALILRGPAAVAATVVVVVVVVVVVALASWLVGWTSGSVRTTKAPGFMDRTLHSGAEKPPINNTILINNPTTSIIIIPIQSMQVEALYDTSRLSLLLVTCVEKPDETLHSAPYTLLLYYGCESFFVLYGNIYNSAITLNDTYPSNS